MTKQYKDKITKLGKLMNSRSKFAIPLVSCIIECFDIVFTEKEVDAMLLMEDGYYTEEQLKTMWTEDLFCSIKSKGGIWQSKESGVYDLTPIFPGWIELYASGPLNEKREALLLKFSEFEELLKSLNIAPIRAYMNYVNTKHMKNEEGRMSTLAPAKKNNLSERRKIKLDKPIKAEQVVYTAGEAMAVLKRNKDKIAVMNCFCRTMKVLKGGSCDYDMPIESCIAVGRMAEQLVASGVAKNISYDEAVLLVDELEKKGCIHTLYHYGTDSTQEEIVLCNCCVDCCFLYNSFRQGALSQLLIKAYYKPENVENIKCTGCNRCSKYCPTEATYYDSANKKLVYDINKCIGCGQCVTQCPVGCRQMVKDERNIFVKTPAKKH